MSKKTTWPEMQEGKSLPPQDQQEDDEMPSPPQRSLVKQPRHTQALYYPKQLKLYYLHVLRALRSALSEHESKPVGWQRIRDMIMFDIDEQRRKELAAEGFSNPQKNHYRSPLLTKDDVAKWINGGGEHHINDEKFYWIDRFLRSRRISETISPLGDEHARARRDYVRHAMVEYFGFRKWFNHQNDESKHRVFAEVFNNTTLITTIPFGQDRLGDKAASNSVLVMLMHDYYYGIIPVDILCVRCGVPKQLASFAEKAQFHFEKDGHPHAYECESDSYNLGSLFSALKFKQQDVAILYSGFLNILHNNTANNGRRFEGKLTLTKTTYATPREEPVSLRRLDTDPTLWEMKAAATGGKQSPNEVPFTSLLPYADLYFDAWVYSTRGFRLHNSKDAGQNFMRVRLYSRVKFCMDMNDGETETPIPEISVMTEPVGLGVQPIEDISMTKIENSKNDEILRNWFSRGYAF